MYDVHMLSLPHNLVFTAFLLGFTVLTGPVMLIWLWGLHSGGHLWLHKAAKPYMSQPLLAFKPADRQPNGQSVSMPGVPWALLCQTITYVLI